MDHVQMIANVKWNMCSRPTILEVLPLNLDILQCYSQSIITIAIS